MKSLLMAKGYSLYRDIWSDQPPLFTSILAVWFRLFGYTIQQARLLVLIFSVAMLWFFYQSIRISWGRLCAFLAVLFLISSTYYIQLSISVMIGIPSLTFFFISFFFISYYGKSGKKQWLILSGIFMAFSLQTKLFTSFLVPLIMLEIALYGYIDFKERRGKKLALPVFIWFGCIFLVYFFIDLLFFDKNLLQIFIPHLKAATNNSLQNFNFNLKLRKALIKDYDVVLLAFTSVVLLIREKKWPIIFPLSWFLFAFIILQNHKPVWYHHYILLSIPLSWLAGIGMGTFFRIKVPKYWVFRLKNHKKLEIIFRFILAGIVIWGWLLVTLPYKFKKNYAILKKEKLNNDKHLIQLILRYSYYTKWMITDSQIYAFYTGLLVPPELAVTSMKRRASGNLSTNYYLEIIKIYKPEQILFSRFNKYPKEILSYINANYSVIYRHDSTKLYLLKKLKKQTNFNLKKHKEK